jgi:hypothetical protein
VVLALLLAVAPRLTMGTSLATEASRPAGGVAAQGVRRKGPGSTRAPTHQTNPGRDLIPEGI